MSALDLGTPSRFQETKGARPLSGITALIVARASAIGGATRSEAARDLHPIAAPGTSASAWRSVFDGETEGLLRAGLLSEAKNRIKATPPGLYAVASLMGGQLPGTLTWEELRDEALVARALGLTGDLKRYEKALHRPEGLAALILQKRYGLSLKTVLSPTRLRSELAVVALERAFGNTLKSGLGSGSGLSGKAGRLLAGQLSKTPRDFGSDGRLVMELAAEAVGASKAEMTVMRMALLAEHFHDGTRKASPGAQRTAESTGTARAKPIMPVMPANDLAPTPQPPPKVVIERPDLEQFTREVKAAAGGVAEGWQGARKAFISRVWLAIRQRRPEWPVSEIEFKGMLVEAHRAGRLLLASADLKTKDSLKDVEQSAILYKNTVWHFVRVED